jgi:type I restriction enzyme, S subunit
MEIKRGYRRSEVGVIPEDWDVKTFRAIGNLSKGKGLLKGGIRRSGSIPAIPYTALYTDYSEVVDYSLVKWFIDDENQSVIVREPCLLLASSSNMEANTGKASALLGGTAVAIGREVIVFKTSADCVYLSYLLSTSFYRKKTLALSRGTTIKHVYPATFQDYLVAHPSIREQSSIAKALSDVDALLSGLDRLIAKKRDLKQAAMQQLVTGQTRLPGFSGEWEVKRLGDLLTICHGKSQRDVESPAGRYPILASGGQIGNANYPLYDKPSVLIGRKGTIDKPQYMDRPFWTVDTLFYSVIKGENNAKFLFYCFCMIDWRQYNEASGVPSLNARTIERIEGAFPASTEQIAIAMTLSDMDDELTALEARRNKTHALKQAMMQELLTGRIRLVDPAPEAELQT